MSRNLSILESFESYLEIIKILSYWLTFLMHIFFISRIAKLIDNTKDGADRARSLFEGISDPKNITMDKFKEIVSKLASDQRKTFDDITKSLLAQGPPQFKSGFGKSFAAVKDTICGCTKKIE